MSTIETAELTAETLGMPKNRNGGYAVIEAPGPKQLEWLRATINGFDKMEEQAMKAGRWFAPRNIDALPFNPFDADLPSAMN